METLCQRCGRKIPDRRLENARRVGKVAKYHSDRCLSAAKQERYRMQAPKTAQDRIHLRNLAAHGMIAAKILQDPAVLEIARENLARWRQQRGNIPALREWEDLIDTGDRLAILSALLRVDEEGMRMRSSSPFTGILTDEERDLIFQSTSK